MVFWFNMVNMGSYPSGDLESSDSDKELTKQLKQVGEVLGIEVLDHVIIGRDGYYSFADKDEL